MLESRDSKGSILYFLDLKLILATIPITSKYCLKFRPIHKHKIPNQIQSCFVIKISAFLTLPLRPPFRTGYVVLTSRPTLKLQLQQLKFNLE